MEMRIIESMSDFLECRLCEELYQKISMTNRICSMCRPRPTGAAWHSGQKGILPLVFHNMPKMQPAFP